MSELNENSNDRILEESLRQLTPLAPNLDSGRIQFLAGQRSVENERPSAVWRHPAWPAVAATMAVTWLISIVPAWWMPVSEDSDATTRIARDAVERSDASRDDRVVQDESSRDAHSGHTDDREEVQRQAPTGDPRGGYWQQIELALTMAQQPQRQELAIVETGESISPLLRRQEMLPTLFESGPIRSPWSQIISLGAN